MENPKPIKIGDYNYPLPEGRIAKYPLPVRDGSKLLVYDKGVVSESVFSCVGDYLDAGELVVFNNTKVIQARLHFRKETGALIEVFCLEPFAPGDYALSFQQTENCTWICLVGNLKKWKDGTLCRDLEVKGRVVTLRAERKSLRGMNHEIEFSWNDRTISFADILECFGELPIPPYLNRATQESDKETYQTVYSKIKGSVAAPTAGLHFTERVLNGLRQKGVCLDEVTLHVGAGTFRPVKSEAIADHDMHTEYISVNKSTIERIIAHGCRVVAVGTTSVRTLESLYYIGCRMIGEQNFEGSDLHINQWEPYEKPFDTRPSDSLRAIVGYLDRNGLDVLHASTQIMIAPGYKYHFVSKMITNFHQPQSTLLLLVSAFVDGDWHAIYDYALTHGFRFLSYGDSSILIP